MTSQRVLFALVAFLLMIIIGYGGCLYMMPFVPVLLTDMLVGAYKTAILDHARFYIESDVMHSLS